MSAQRWNPRQMQEVKWGEDLMKKSNAGSYILTSDYDKLAAFTRELTQYILQVNTMGDWCRLCGVGIDSKKPHDERQMCGRCQTWLKDNGAAH